MDKRFVVVGDLNTGFIAEYGDALEVLGCREVSASAIAFTRDVVWVGTDRGLFAYERWARSWNAYSVGRKHLRVPVTRLELKGSRLRVTIRLPGGPATWTFDPAQGKWDKG